MEWQYTATTSRDVSTTVPIATRSQLVRGLDRMRDTSTAQTLNRGRIRSGGETHQYQQKQQQQQGQQQRQHERIEYNYYYSDSIYRLHGEANDAAFSYKHDHFQHYNTYPDDLFSPVGQQYNNNNNNNNNNFNNHNNFRYDVDANETYQSCSSDDNHNYNNNNIDDDDEDEDEFCWVVHKHPKHRNEIVNSDEGKPDKIETIHSHHSRQEEGERQEEPYLTPKEYTSVREEEIPPMPVPIEVNTGNVDLKSMDSGLENEIDSKVEERQDPCTTNTRCNNSSSSSSSTTSTVQDNPPNNIAIDDTQLESDSIHSLEELSNAKDKTEDLWNHSIDIDEEALKAEAAEEVAYIVALSKSNHYSIMINKDYNPNNPNDNNIGATETNHNTETVENSNSSSYNFDKTRHDRLLQQVERNKESLNEIKAKLSLHSSILGKDASHPIDVTAKFDESNNGKNVGGRDHDCKNGDESDTENETDTKSQSKRSEDELEAALYRHFEAAMEAEERDENPLNPSQELYDAIREPNDSNSQTIEGIDLRDSTTTAENREPTSIQHHETMINPHFERDRNATADARFRDASPASRVGGTNTPLSETRDEREWDPRKKMPTPSRSDFARLKLEPRVQPFRGTDSAASKTESFGPAHRTIVENPLIRPILPKRNEVGNILIDLIRREKFNFAIQRVHYFPHEAFVPVSDTLQNLALHETIDKMLVRNNDNFVSKREKGENRLHEHHNDSQVVSKLSMLLIETNPKALSTPGNGGYLPLHVACSSPFRDCGVERRLSLIRTMLVMHPEGAQHNDNETGELPLHLAIRWICSHRQVSGLREDDKQEGEAIVVFLLMANPSGATIQDRSGCTPCQILYNHQCNDEGYDDWPLFQRLGRCLLFASQLSQENCNENGDWDSGNIVNSEFFDIPPIDQIEFAETRNERMRSSAADNREHGALGNGTNDHAWNDASRRKEKPSPERIGKDGNFQQSKRKTKSTKSRRTKDKWDSDFADKLLYELLDAADE